MIRDPRRPSIDPPGLDGSPVLRFAIHEDGALEVLSPWFPRVAFTVDVLARADGRRLLVRGDELEIRCTNGGATYALAPVDDQGLRHGHLLSVRGAPRC